MRDLCLFLARIDKPKALSLLLHTADISHPAKNWDLHHRWTTSLLEEFFRQVRPSYHRQEPVSSFVSARLGRTQIDHRGRQ